MKTLLFFGFCDGVGIFVDSLIKLFVLKIKQNGGFFNFANLEDVFDNLFSGEWGFGLFENTGDDLRNSSLFLAPIT